MTTAADFPSFTNFVAPLPRPHKRWHEFRRGMCLYCGWYCADCPKGVATCKCPPARKEGQK